MMGAGQRDHIDPTEIGFSGLQNGGRAARLLSTKPVTVRGLNYVPSAWHLVLHEHIDFEGAVLYVEARRGRHVTVMMWPLQESGSGCCITRNADAPV